MEKNRNKIISFILVACLFVFYGFIFVYNHGRKDIDINKLLINVVSNTNINFDYHFASEYDYYNDRSILELKNSYESSLLANDDFVGIVDFPCKSFSRQVVQGNDNLEYLNKNWVSGNYSDVGSIFLDSNDSFDGSCLRIYGNNDHFSFGRVLELYDSGELKNETIFAFVREKEIRYYKVVSIEKYEDYLDDIVDNAYNVSLDSYDEDVLIIVIKDRLIITGEELGRDRV